MFLRLGAYRTYVWRMNDEPLTPEELEQVRRSLALSPTLAGPVAHRLLAEIHRLRAELAKLEADEDVYAGRPSIVERA